MASRIYTRTGDNGQTGLFGGQRVYKDDPRVEAYGATDELNALLGVAIAQCEDRELAALLLSLQEQLFDLGADLATPLDEETRHGRSTVRRMDAEDVERLERLIDQWEAELPALRNFILPGGHPVSAALHQGRAVCRRAERACVTLMRSGSESGAPLVSQDVIIYLNRLSDLLFVLSRAANRRHAVEDILWKP